MQTAYSLFVCIPKSKKLIMDQMVLETQKWLNDTYSADARYESIPENGKTGWTTIYALIRALQIELGLPNTADNFGPGTAAAFQHRYPNGVKQQADSDASTSNVYSIIQGALWCKGYSLKVRRTPLQELMQLS